MKFFEKVAKLRKLKGIILICILVGYRNVSIEIWTHAINGLSLNDFILAAQIDELPIESKLYSIRIPGQAQPVRHKEGEAPFAVWILLRGSVFCQDLVTLTQEGYRLWLVFQKCVI